MVKSQYIPYWGDSMRKQIVVFLSVLISLLLCSISFAHPGNTDYAGGHFDWSTGEYHYHHGFPAHQHENGICPYDYIDATTSQSLSPEDVENMFATNKDLKSYIDELEREIKSLTQEKSELSERISQLEEDAKNQQVWEVAFVIAFVLLLIAFFFKGSGKNREIEGLKQNVKDMNAAKTHEEYINLSLRKELELLKDVKEAGVSPEVLKVKASKKTKKYHTLACRSAPADAKTVFIYEVPSYYTPCKLCKPIPLDTVDRMEEVVKQQK